jgi:Uncharacterised nucleotidyltransferase
MTRSDVSPEDRLCLVLAPKDVQPCARELALTLLERPLRWELILDQVVREGILPLFFVNLRRFGFPGVPVHVQRWLETAFKLNAVRNESMAMELARVLTLFGEAGIPVIPLKGVALSECLYGDTSLRVCGDLDILVPRSLVARSIQVLLRNRYEAHLPEETLIRIPLGNAIEYEFTRSDGPIGCRLELHWGMFSGSRNDERAAAEVWRESKPAIFFGVTGRRMSPEWEFLYLAAHAARHRCESLKWLADMHDMVSLRPFDRERLSDAARRHGWSSALGLSLDTCGALMGTVLPLKFVRSAPCRGCSQSVPFSPQAMRDLFVFRQLKGGRNKLSFLIRRAFLPNFSDYSLVHLPHSLRSLYYLLRPFRVACRCGFQLLRFPKTWRRFQNPRAKKL